MNAPPPGFVAIDLGATSGRVMLGVVRPGPDGPGGPGPGSVELVECGRFGNGPVAVPGGASGWELRWDVLALWRGIAAALRGAARQAERLGVEIRGIGVDSWAVDHGLLDGDGRLLAAPWCYRDERFAAVPEAVYERIPAEEHYAVNGLQTLPFTTEFQLVAGRADAAWAAADRLLLVPDLVSYWLTGRAVTEVTNASTTGLLDARTRDWSHSLLARLAEEYPELGELRARLADLVEPGAVVGPLAAAVQEATGLGAVTVYAVASHDTASAVAAAPLGAAAPGAAAYISSGTWSLVGLELPEPVLTEASREANFTNELGLDGTVRYLRNVMGLWVLDECVRHWEAEGEPVDRVALLDAAAAEPRWGVLIDVDGQELLAPGDMPRRVADAVVRAGGAAPKSRAALARVVLDSLAAAYARAIAQASALAGVEVEAVHVVGGGAQNKLLCRLTAEATGLPVIAGPVEATALGNVLVQARAAGVLGDGTDLADLRRVVVASTELRRYSPQGQVRIRV